MSKRFRTEPTSEAKPLGSRRRSELRNYQVIGYSSTDEVLYDDTHKATNSTEAEGMASQISPKGTDYYVVTEIGAPKKKIAMPEERSVKSAVVDLAAKSADKAPADEKSLAAATSFVVSSPSVATEKSGQSTSQSTVQSTTPVIHRSYKVQATITKRNVEKSGNIAFSLPGVRASVYFNKNIFGEGAVVPASFKIVPLDANGDESDVDPFAKPGEAKTPVSKMTKEERIANLVKARAARANETPTAKAARLRKTAEKMLKNANKVEKSIAAEVPAEPVAV